VLLTRAGGAIFVGENRAFTVARQGDSAPAANPRERPLDAGAADDPARAIFVSSEPRRDGDPR
jgi:hypothetical protein